MAHSSFRVGDIVQPASIDRMLDLCGTYHAGVTHGQVVDIHPELSESVVVQWHYGDGTVCEIGYSLLPFDLRHSTDVCGHNAHAVRIARTGAGNGYPHRAECVCGWRSRGYAATHAAADMGRAHMAGEVA